MDIILDVYKLMLEGRGGKGNKIYGYRLGVFIYVSLLILFN